MYPIPPNETIVETKKCTHCGVSFEITDKDLEFYDKVSPVFGGVKYNIPTPTFCPDCRQQRRLSFRNERKLYKWVCDLTGKNIISIYAPQEVLLGCSPGKPFKVYEQSEWWSDKWDAMDYGRDFDFKRRFFEQFERLMKEVPHQNISNPNSENCNFSQIAHSKNCYLTFVWGFSENVLYWHWVVNVKDSSDCVRCQNIDSSFDCLYCYDGFWLYSCFQCKWSSNCYFSWNLVGCKDCFLSGNLVNKQYVFKNIQLNKEQYESEMKKLNIHSNYFNFFTERNILLKKSLFRLNQNFESENCSWDYIKNSWNCINSFEITDNHNCKNFYDNAWDCVDCMDCSYGKWGRNCLETLIATWDSDIFWIYNALPSSHLYYCKDCHSSSHLFWCIGLRNKSYCILNKQYTKEEYEILVPQIIEHMIKTGEWWEFFPSSISPFGYNETVAQEYFPFTKEQALEGWFKWSDYENPFPKVEKIIPASKLPDDISKIPDDILNWAVECEVTGKPFRIIKQELEFYRKHNLPIPRRHPDQRHSDRIKLRNPRKLFERKCDKCGIEMMTTYSPERKEIVYCEGCYNKEIL